MRTDSLTRESVNHIKINQYDNMYVTDSQVSESVRIFMTYSVVFLDALDVGFRLHKKIFQNSNGFVTDDPPI